MDYKLWSQAYQAEAERVWERMERVRQETDTGNREQEVVRQRRLAILYEMYRDCRHTARILEHRAQ